jgi:CheY-like chemotaxis protein
MEENRSSLPLRVLVVDDCPDTLESMATLLRLWGHDVRVAGNGPGALDAAAHCRPDVVLLDVGLPGMNGYQVARRLRAEYSRGETLLVTLSGYGQDTDRHRSLEAGCDDHWLKPIDPSDVQRRLVCWKKEHQRETPASARGPSEPSVPPAPSVTEAAERLLRRNSYLALKNVVCEFHDGVLTLRGCLPSYHLKQVALAAVSQLEGVQRIENQIEVVPPST